MTKSKPDVVSRAVRDLARVPAPSQATMARDGVVTASASIDVTKELQARPTCAMCDKPVESFTETEQVFTNHVVFIARCHGATQRIRVERELVQLGSVSFGMAFLPEHRVAAPPARKLLGPGGPPHVDCDCISCRPWTT